MDIKAQRFRQRVVESRVAVYLFSALIIAMRVGMFILNGDTQPEIQDTGYVWRFIAPLIREPWLSFGISTLLVFAIGFIMANNHKQFTLIRSRATLSFVIPPLLLSVHPYFLHVTPELIAAVIVLCAFAPLFESYQQTDTHLLSFRSGILLAIASLFSIFVLILIPIWWKNEHTMRGNNTKSFVSSFLGILMIYWTLFACYYFFNQLDKLVEPFYQFAEINYTQLPTYSATEWISLIIAVIILIFFMFTGTSRFIRDKVLTLITAEFVNFIMGVGLILQVVYWSQTNFFIVMNIPLVSFLISYYFSNLQSHKYITVWRLFWVAIILIYLLNTPVFGLITR